MMTYSDTKLREIRRNYLRENKPEEYDGMMQDGTLEEHLTSRASQCRREQARILREGWTKIDSQAWSWAIRSELLDSQWD